MSKAEIDNQKTTEFFEDIINGNFVSDNNCILKNHKWKLFFNVNEFKKYLKGNLKIENETHLDFQIEKYENFVITNKIVPNKNLITNKQFKSFSKSWDIDEFKYLDWLESNNCENGFLSFSRPFFNETYDLAIIYREHICGPLCGGNWTIIYELIDNDWKLKEVIDHTIK